MDSSSRALLQLCTEIAIEIARQSLCWQPKSQSVRLDSLMDQHQQHQHHRHHHRPHRRSIAQFKMICLRPTKPPDWPAMGRSSKKSGVRRVDEIFLKLLLVLAPIMLVVEAQMKPAEHQVVAERKSNLEPSANIFLPVSSREHQKRHTTTEEIDARQPRGKRTLYACEEKQLQIECQLGESIQLIRANYGRFSIQICNEHGQLDWKVNCMSLNSNQIIANR